MLENHGAEIRAVADGLEGVEVEGADGERERVAFVLRTLVDRALTDLAEDGRFEARGNGEPRSGTGTDFE